MTRVVHYINQFFAGIGAEEAAGTTPDRKDGPIGPGKRLQELLGDEYEIVATVFCGDDYAAGTKAAADKILELFGGDRPDLVIAGPAFTSGRYGLACARVAEAAQHAGINALAAMHEDNPGVEEAGPAPVVRSGAKAREMRSSLEQLAAAAHKIASGEPLTREDGRVGKIPRRGTRVERNAAQRAVDVALARLAGDRDATEVAIPSFDHVTPAPPVQDPSQAVIALLTEGALVPSGNPDRLESARATRWLRYALEAKDSLVPADYVSVHGGFSPVWANEDPHRILPLDVARELESEGIIGSIYNEYFVTTGNGTSVANARKFGVEWAGELRRAGVQAVIMTST